MGRRVEKVRTIDILIFAAIVSIVLYLSGVFSGLNAERIIQRQVRAEFDELKAAMDNSALDLKNIQLQQIFIDNFEPADKCRFLDLYMENLYSQISYYWEVLPYRLEEYEKTQPASEEYVTLKREYTRLSLRFWLIASRSYAECGNLEFIPVLYFYSKECDWCVEQGEEFDKFNLMMKDVNRTVLVFPVDADFADDTVFLLKKFYNITSTPAIVVEDLVIQERIVDSEMLAEIFEVE
ncbi:hypothetical protein KY320_03265 [Candidatus Woesearchaeota archaeon]|nr:hypothetical protein [Candidatus Woesearchaeota archaeon]